jgi:hypothetical protein
MERIGFLRELVTESQGDAVVRIAPFTLISRNYPVPLDFNSRQLLGLSTLKNLAIDSSSP